MIRKLFATSALTASMAAGLLSGVGTAQAGDTNLYWGDTHLHTRNSLDAFLVGNLTADPDTAYRWAKGKPVIHPYHRAWIQIDTPLDFLAVTDHAEYMGVMPAIYEGRDDEFGEVGFIDSLVRWYLFRTIRNAVDRNEGTKLFGETGAANDTDGPTDVREIAAGPGLNVNMPIGSTDRIEQSTWDAIADAAERHNKPGEFTAFIGWEWSTIPGGANLHRIVLSPTNGETAKQWSPFGSDDSQQPQELWAWLNETTKRTGAPFIAIPHNSNVSKGYMFAETTLKGEKMTSAYAALRAEMEPVVEITQIKGDSETWPTLSPNDKFADFNAFPHYLGMKQEDYVAHEGDFIRPTLKNGLKIEQEIGVNPFKFGVIGSTDAHSGISSADSNNFHGKMAQDSVPENKRKVIGPSMTGWSMDAAGYAGVWAEENTRESLFAAFKRREVYASTGPRIRLRVFGGYQFDEADAHEDDIASIGYERGVPMGGDLIADQDRAAQLLIRATKDPKGANLDRVQVIKGWVDAEGQTHEKIYNVAWSGDRALDDDGELPDVGNTVNLSDARYTNTIGTGELETVWADPNYDPAMRAFYYVRVLEIPTPRHSLYDEIALNQAHNDKDAGPATIQERAYSSPIWVTP